MPDSVPLLLRAVAVSFALVLAVMVAGSTRKARAAMLPMLLCLVAYLIRSAPESAGLALPALLIVHVGALLFPVALWWLVHNAFEDRTDLPWLAWAGLVVLLISGLTAGGVSTSMQKATAAAFVLVALWRIWATRSDDLVDGRRAARGWLLAYAGLHGLVILAVELALGDSPPPSWLDALNQGAIALALGVALAFFVQVDAVALQTLLGDEPPKATSKEEVPSAPSQSPGDSGTNPLVDRLLAAMTVDHVYRDAELSLKGLAHQLAMPEYRLREVINHRLGFRNFPAFINHYRLDEVEQKMVDPAFDRRPLLTLALEAGFGSIGPFNRAFRERHGITPTSFRQQRGATPAAS